MDIGNRRRKKSQFRPWNSYLGKKQTADAAAVAVERAADVSALRKLTVGLIETYEGINTAYYEKKKRESHRASKRASATLLNKDSSTATRTASDGDYVPHHRSTNSNAAITHSLAQTSIHDASSQPHHTRAKENNPAHNVSALNGSALNGSVSDRKDAHATSSPHSVQYCDENHDYIVRTGDMFNNRYMLEKVIGRGSFGQVVRAYDTFEKSHVAIKIIKNNSLYVEQALSEVRMTSYLNRIDPDDAHSIMRLRDKFIFRGHQCLVLELLSFSLYDLLRSTEFYGVSLNLVRKFSRQILNCLAFLARPDVNIAHCDLKPENVLLRHPQRSAIKVVDFGASCRISESMFTYVQSRFYRAPEVILGLPYNTQVDVWSLGCMLVELHTGYPLFAGRDERDQMAIIVERLGMPPKHMLDKGKKTLLFFEQHPETGEWTLRDGISRSEEPVIPGSKPVEAFVDSLTGAPAGRRKRASDGHSEVDYEIFLSLANDMLKYDPRERLTAEKALQNLFVRGETMTGSSSRCGRDSPPPMPGLGNVTATVPKQVDPGRRAPVHRTIGEGDTVRFADLADGVVRKVGGLKTGGGTSGGSSTNPDHGGALRLSKSEPAFDPVPQPVVPVAQPRDFVFHASEWAEEVGIEPPPWRAGGKHGIGVSMAGSLADCFGDGASALMKGLSPAGGGCKLPQRRACSPPRRQRHLPPARTVLPPTSGPLLEQQFHVKTAAEPALRAARGIPLQPTVSHAFYRLVPPPRGAPR